MLQPSIKQQILLTESTHYLLNLDIGLEYTLQGKCIIPATDEKITIIEKYTLRRAGEGKYGGLRHRVGSYIQKDDFTVNRT